MDEPTAGQLFHYTGYILEFQGPSEDGAIYYFDILDKPHGRRMARKEYKINIELGYMVPLNGVERAVIRAKKYT